MKHKKTALHLSPGELSCVLYYTLLCNRCAGGQPAEADPPPPR